MLPKNKRKQNFIIALLVGKKLIKRDREIVNSREKSNFKDMIKKNSKRQKEIDSIASLIFQDSFSVLSKDREFSDEEKGFLAIEMSFFMFFIIAGTCIADNLCSKDLILDLEDSLAKEYETVLGGSLNSYKEAIRQRFSTYANENYNNEEATSWAREGKLLYAFKKSVEDKGIFLGPFPAVPVLCNALHRTKLQVYLITLADTINTIIYKIKNTLK